ncbi:MAG: hypothetical protein JWO43_548, partial [Candidatus Adlerbacteria bacterium]|nr:hypothetical protein [Candidatus Adlerbacteria bacterium]
TYVWDMPDAGNTYVQGKDTLMSGIFQTLLDAFHGKVMIQ